jgi:membrane associated rhomboid family serine protease
MRIKYPFEIGCFLLLLVVFNLPILTDQISFSLYPSTLWMIEPWRWFTFAWHHISLYHLLMDGAAFVILYQSLRCGFGERLQHLVLCILFSGLIPILIDERLWAVGLCGLSGVAHGMMLIGALETVVHPDKNFKKIGFLMFCAVLGKTIFEQITGSVLFAEHHLGNVGIPIAACHTGGLVGALLSSILSIANSRTTQTHRMKIRKCSMLVANSNQ